MIVSVCWSWLGLVPARMFTAVEAATVVVAIVNVAVVAPMAKATLAGTVAPAPVRITGTENPGGAGASIVTVALTEVPPVTVDGLKLRAVTTGGRSVKELLTLAPLPGLVAVIVTRVETDWTLVGIGNVTLV